MIFGSSRWKMESFVDGEAKKSKPDSFPANPDVTRKYEPHRAAIQRHIEFQLTLNFQKKQLKGRIHLVMQALRPNDLETLVLDAKELKIDAVQFSQLETFDETRFSGLKTKKTQNLAFEVGDDKLKMFGIQHALHHSKLPGQRNSHAHRADPIIGDPDAELFFVLSIDYSVTKPNAGIYFISPEDFPWVTMPCIWTQGQDVDSPYWFPCQDDPRLKVTTLMTVVAPEGWMTESNGERIEGKNEWVMRQAHAPYLVALVSGEFERLDGTFETQSGRKSLHVLTPPQHQKVAKDVLKKTKEMLESYGRYWNFDFPWPRYVQAFVPEFLYGGMENTGLTLNTENVLGEKNSVNSLQKRRDSLVMHEMAHQWFGNTVTCASWSEGWLNEGFATHSEIIWEEHAQGSVDAIFYANDVYRQSYLSEAKTYTRPLVCNHYEFVSEIFDSHLYDKGALVLNHLRDLIGPMNFRRSVKHYLDANAFQPVDTTCLMKSIEETSGWNPREFFDNYVYSSGHFSVSAHLTREGNNLHIEIDVQSSLSNHASTLETWLAIYNDQGLAEEQRLTLHTHQRTLRIPVPPNTCFAVLDPRATTVGEVTVTFSEVMAKAVLNLQNVHKNGYFVWLATQSLLKKSNIHNEETYHLICKCIKKESSASAREKIYKTLGESGVRLSSTWLLEELNINELAEIQKHEPDLQAQASLLRCLAMRATPADEAVFEHLVDLAQNKKEELAIRKAAFDGLDDLLRRCPALRSKRMRKRIFPVALNALAEPRFQGQLGQSAVKVVNEFMTEADLNDLIAIADNSFLPGRNRFFALQALAEASAIFPQQRRDIRPLLKKHSEDLLPSALVAPLPNLWAQTQDPELDATFQKFLSRKNYGILSMFIPYARRAYQTYIRSWNESSIKGKLTQIEEISRKVEQLEFEVKSLTDRKKMTHPPHSSKKTKKS